MTEELVQSAYAALVDRLASASPAERADGRFHVFYLATLGYRRPVAAEAVRRYAIHEERGE